ncbi:hypothetical protein [Natronorubrum sp. A-ect3]|uniref:hypothetical protein n=1 Tax=Natronorubrum sp. A-ect3 TaxID=3242698 RepID=UPI00359CEE29
MSSWIRVTFDSGDRSVTTVEEQLREALEDPDTVRWPDALVWKAQEEIDAERLTDLGVEARRALVVWANDTAMAGDGRLYERIDGRFVPVDAMSGVEGFVGRDVTSYFQREYGLLAEHR